IFTLTGWLLFTVIVIVLLVAGLPVGHGLIFEVSTTVIASLLANVLVMYVSLVSPLIAMLFFFHWYRGDEPPLVGVAVNVTVVPLQMVLSASSEEMFTLTGWLAFTVIVIVLLVAG